MIRKTRKSWGYHVPNAKVTHMALESNFCQTGRFLFQVDQMEHLYHHEDGLRMQNSCTLNSNLERLEATISIALAVFAAALLSSCVQEKSFNDKPIGKNDIVFTLLGTPATRSIEDMSIVRKGVTIEIADDKFGLSRMVR